MQTPSVLKKGDTDSSVLSLKQQLALSSVPPADIVLNEIFDESTEHWVMAYQTSVGLVVDGIVGDKTRSVLNLGTKSAALLGHQDLERAADSLNIPLAVMRALNEVISLGMGFVDHGLASIRFERHIFYARLKRNGHHIKKLSVMYPDLVNPEVGDHLTGMLEWTRLHRAMSIDKQAAVESTAWGAFQTMGFHWKALKYASVDEFVSKMNRSEAMQLEAFVRFVKAHPPLQRALQQINFTDFARLYYGVAYAKGQYDLKIAKAFVKYSKNRG
ncbi:N-acetylmuramidase domain-containing protein [Agitococcus lubricus]|uniref:Peptidoglycan hydrolase-like protein with peptidoglycan-binding domain n=1 Tax=Agitococcus lubricus TaxID=1077255 RepID=A0A2T5IZM8_9GAMM|nr:N-acetylmuramidase domain-containing protein [Agitococcus lubricus]PTQ89517.1 peptidoglycan hydrolase-like protein with peptidoglycan-binding domain [Agitococcus lubricus]